ncbi:hypothetical protein DPMN_104407 [Dreissena polymorpha]|uniref:Uncharacterized protein n=1 Tax=Dreissena polymorpha TaxID=45954 RepID=A0A9D4H9W7_DREPO|nr:hypothetical protein DPMN_104407 [Dreissena polymorpha]
MAQRSAAVMMMEERAFRCSLDSNENSPLADRPARNFWLPKYSDKSVARMFNLQTAVNTDIYFDMAKQDCNLQ